MRWAKVHEWVVRPVGDGVGVTGGYDQHAPKTGVPSEDIDGN
jgi:hypothetical protein